MTTSPLDVTLVLRVNCTEEIERTSGSIDSITKSGTSRVITTVSSHAEAVAAVCADTRFDNVIRHDPSVRDIQAVAASLDSPPSTVVLCLGLARGVPYARLLASFLRTHGKKLVALAGGPPQPLAIGGFFRLIGLAISSTIVGGIGIARVKIDKSSQAWWQANKPRILRKLVGRPNGKQKTAAQVIQDKELKRVLLIRVDRVGDLVMSLPALHALNDYLGPNVEVDVLTTPYSAPVLQGQPEISRVFLWTSMRPENIQGKGESAARRLITILKLRLRSYDLAIDLRGDDEARELALASGARRRTGHLRSRIERKEGSATDLLTDPVTFDDLGDPTYQYNLRFMEKLGVPPSTRPYRLTVDATSSRAVRKKLLDRGVRSAYGAIHTRGSQTVRDWSPERFASVAEQIVAQYDIDVVLTGGVPDSAYNDQIIEKLTAYKDRVFNIAGALRLSELGALYKDARVVVTLDTGPMHIAAAVGTPTVGIFLPWQAVRYRPFGPFVEVLVPPGPSAYPEPDPIIDRADTASYLDGLTPVDVIHAVNRLLVRYRENQEPEP